MGFFPWLEKYSFLDSLKFLFLWLTISLFGCRMSLNIFFWPILPKKKNAGKIAIFDQNQGLTRLEKSQFFRLFDLVVFIA